MATSTGGHDVQLELYIRALHAIKFNATDQHTIWRTSCKDSRVSTSALALLNRHSHYSATGIRDVNVHS